LRVKEFAGAIPKLCHPNNSFSELKAKLTKELFVDSDSEEYAVCSLVQLQTSDP